MYRDTYVLPNNGALPGWRLFTRGMTLDYQKTGDPASRDGAIAISRNAAFAAPHTFLPYALSAYSSREVAYSILSYLDAEEFGAPRHPVSTSTSRSPSATSTNGSALARSTTSSPSWWG
ncbi:MAG: hypothetical protein ABR576_11860 [Thermoanaerobaculia bacterium]